MLDKSLSFGYHHFMTQEQKLIIAKYHRLRESNLRAVKKWRERHPEYERSEARRAYKKQWARNRREDSAITTLNTALQP